MDKNLKFKSLRTEGTSWKARLPGNFEGQILELWRQSTVEAKLLNSWKWTICLMMQSRAISRIYLAGLSPMHWIAKSVVWPCLVVACHEIISKIWALTYLSLPIQSKAPVKPLYIGFRWYHLALWFWSRVLTLVPISLISLYGTTWYCESQQLENVRLIGVVTLGRLADEGFLTFFGKKAWHSIDRELRLLKY